MPAPRQACTGEAPLVQPPGAEPQSEAIMHQHLHAAGSTIHEQIRVVRSGLTEDAHHAGKRRIHSGTHVQRLDGKPSGIDPDHFSKPLATQRTRVPQTVATLRSAPLRSPYLDPDPRIGMRWLLDPGGKYFERSPIMHAHKTKTATLSTCGVLDRCTPPEEAVQFHNALLENGAKSVLVTYPQEGHGVRKWPALVDYAARMVGWFEEHIPAASKRS
jgi:Prolyl oligopeptidase family